MRGFLEDLRYSFRLFRKSPGFAFLATACLALGIGANASIFSLLNALLLRTLPLHDADRLVVLHRGNASTFSYPDYKDLRSRSKSFSGLLAAIPTESSLDRTGHQGQLITAEAVSANYAQVLELGTALGDWFDNEDAPVAVISYRSWKGLFAGDPRVLGQQVRSESQWYTIVGVAPKEFTGISSPMVTSIWVPLRIWVNQHPSIRARMENRESSLVMIFGRLLAGVNDPAATAELQSIDRQLHRETIRRSDSRRLIAAQPLRGVSMAGNRASVRTIVMLLFAVVGLLLMICCINVGNLLLVRGAARQREIAIRYVLGASRGHIMRQCLTDSLLLACAGTLAGFAVESATLRIMMRILPGLTSAESITQIPLDSHVVGFLVLLAIATVFLFGLLPAWRTSSINPSAGMKQVPGSVQGVKLRRFSIVAQVALSFSLLLVAGLFLQTCWRLQRADPGFAVENRIYATTYISQPEFIPEQVPAFYEKVLQDLRAVPFVRSTGLTYLLPLYPPATECASTQGSNRMAITTSIISEGFLRTMDIPILRGRDFGPFDTRSSERVVLVNQALAERLWPNASPVGQQIRLGCGESQVAAVVGIVGNSRTVSLGNAPGPHVYLPFSQNPTGLANIVVETSAPMGSAMDLLRRHLLNEGHGMRVYAVNRLSDHVQQSYWQLRWESWLLSGFGVVALMLAAFGLYGLTSYSTTLRTKEFGVRMALGAQPADVFRLVVREGLALALTGVGIGFVVSLSVTPILAAFLFGMQATAALVYMCIAALLVAVAGAACYLPARRSASVEPSVTLRYE